MRGKAISYRIHTPSGFSCLSIPYIGEQNMNIGGGRKIFERGGGELAPGGTCSPCHCGARRGSEPPAALAIPAAAVPEGRRAPGGTCTPCPGGEDHLKRRSSSPPVPPSPWLPALHPVNKQKPLVVQVPPPAKPWGCKGRSPLHKKAKNLPLPRRGRGSFFVYFAGGFAPGTPALNRLRHLQNLPSRCPTGERNPRFNAKPTGSGSA